MSWFKHKPPKYPPPSKPPIPKEPFKENKDPQK